MIFNGDCLEVLKGMPSESIDSLVTDPPAGISFMNQEWDHHKGGRDAWIGWMQEVMTEVLRVLKPGAHGLVWALPRTSHWTAFACEKAGFEVRDCITHVFGQGFPKSINLEKHIDKMGMLCQCDAYETNKTKAGVPYMWTGIHSEKQDSVEQSEVLQPRVLWKMESAECGSEGALARHCSPRQESLVEGDRDKVCGEHKREEESLMERGQVYRAGQGIRDGSQAGSSESETERLCVRTYPGDGKKVETPAVSRRGGASHQSQSEGQSSIQPDAIQVSQGALGNSPQDRLYCCQCGKVKTEEVKGYGSALKPASEHWWLLRKPLSEKTVAKNVLKHGTGALNIDASRIGTGEDRTKGGTSGVSLTYGQAHEAGHSRPIGGRFPANILFSHHPDCELVGIKEVKPHNGSGKASSKANGFRSAYVGGEKKAEGFGADHSKETVPDYRCHIECAVAELDRQSGLLGNAYRPNRDLDKEFKAGNITREGMKKLSPTFPDQGGASRFFYCAKASRKDKNEGLEGMPEKYFAPSNGAQSHGECYDRTQTIGLNRVTKRQNHHPTVKSTKLMEYLITMVTPPNGIVLDPFAGSFSTGIAAVRGGFGFVGIEKEEEYFKIGQARLASALASCGMVDKDKASYLGDSPLAQFETPDKGGYDEQE